LHAKTAARRAAPRKPVRKQTGVRIKLVRYVLVPLAILAGASYASAILCLFALKFIDPPTTSVQLERQVQSWFGNDTYHKQYTFVPLNRISLPFQHAVIAAEDTRFFQHGGFDWRQVQRAAAEDWEGKRLRGASTIDQQLVKNLFLTTSRTPLRKVLEAGLVPPAEIILGKQRILELYLNVVEWGPGVFGAEAAAHYHYGISARQINREQGARLAAVLPAPRTRRPAAMNRYTSQILTRMQQMGW
jgi:monofunctional biosynthetic peptidoglycan transglycosylase